MDPLEGDSKSEFLHALVSCYYRPAYRLFLRRGFSPQDSDDLAQETFLRVCRAFDTFRHDSSLEAWIFKIALNVLRRTFRDGQAAKRRGTVISLDAQEDERETLEKLVYEQGSEGDPLDRLLQSEQQRRLKKAVDEMPAQMRRCALLRFDIGLKYREIAVVLDLSIQTVKSHLFEARERLKAILSDQS